MKKHNPKNNNKIVATILLIWMALVLPCNVSANNGSRSIQADSNSDVKVHPIVQQHSSNTVGNLIWEVVSQPDLGLNAMVIHGHELFIAGGAATGPESSDVLVQAYDSRDGTLLWESIVDLGGNPAGDLSVLGNRIFISSVLLGQGQTILALNRKTGELLWHSLFEFVYGSSVNHAVKAKGDRVYVTGSGGVHAYDVNDGRLIWSDTSAGSSGISLRGNQIFVVGGSSFQSYRGISGDLLWEVDEGMASADVTETHGPFVFIAGRMNDQHREFFMVRARDSKTGGLVWEDRFDAGNLPDFATDIVAIAGRVFVVGFGSGDFIVRCYEASTGTLLWSDRYDSGGFDGALAVSANDKNVFVAGRSGTDFLIRTYDNQTGVLLWDDRVPGLAKNVVAKGNSVFVAGGGSKPGLVIRAYNSR